MDRSDLESGHGLHKSITRVQTLLRRGFGTLLHERLDQPLQRKKPTKYFVNSISDLFHEQVPNAFIDAVFDVIARTPTPLLVVRPIAS